MSSRGAADELLTELRRWPSDFRCRIRSGTALFRKCTRSSGICSSPSNDVPNAIADTIVQAVESLT